MDFLKNFIPCFAITLACFAGCMGMVFLFLAVMPPELHTMSATEVAQGAGGWKALMHATPLILLISVLVASWVAAMKPFTSPRMGYDENGDIVFGEPMIK